METGEEMFGMKKIVLEAKPIDPPWSATGRRRFVRWNKHYGLRLWSHDEKSEYIFFPQIEEQRSDIISGKSGIAVRWRDATEADLPDETIV